MSAVPSPPQVERIGGNAGGMGWVWLNEEWHDPQKRAQEVCESERPKSGRMTTAWHDEDTRPTRS